MNSWKRSLFDMTIGARVIAGLKPRVKTQGIERGA